MNWIWERKQSKRLTFPVINMSKILYFKPNKGLIDWSNRSELHNFLLDNDGKDCYAKMDKVKGVRSLDQNSLYWLYLDVIAKETGNTVDDLHRLFKGLFLPKKEVTFKGKKYMMSGSTTKLTKAEMGEYLDKICAETNIPIPDKQTASIVLDYPENNMEPKF